MKNLKKYSILLLSMLFINSLIFSQEINYKISAIPDSIKKHAEAVIRLDQETITIKNINKANYRIKKVISILKKSGVKHAFIVAPYDNKMMKIVSLSGKYYDSSGDLIKKVKYKDIKDISYYSGLFSDNRIKYVEKPLFTPPYTVEYEIESENIGILDITNWIPVRNYNVSLEKAILNVTTPKDYKYRTEEKNFTGLKEEYSDKNKLTKTWVLENIKAVLPEPFNNSISNLVPSVHIAPNNFSVDGFQGNMNSWQNFGKWIIKLNKGRDNLPDETVTKIINLTKNLPDEKSKAKAIYEYMQNRTRYVSIQLGIGGWQPFEAGYTDRNGYGDCKALSYYMQSLLKAVGINSYYTIVRAGDNAKPILTDFPSLQFNHAILCLPFKNDTTWLECTDQKIPFGYLCNFTDDRDVLIITEQGGKLAHTTSYSEDINTQIRKANINLSSDGQINAEIHTNYKGLQYDNISYMKDLSDVDKIKRIKKRITLPALTLDSFEYENHKDIIPSADEYLKINVRNYASLSSGRLFLIPNLLNRRSYVPKKLKNRKSEIIFKFAYTDIDTLIYNLPENLIKEFIPENIAFKTKFGDYSASFNLENRKLIYIRKVTMHKGVYPPSDYEDFKKFFKLTVDSDKQVLVFKISK